MPSSTLAPKDAAMYVSPRDRWFVSSFLACLAPLEAMSPLATVPFLTVPFLCFGPSVFISVIRRRLICHWGGAPRRCYHGSGGEPPVAAESSVIVWTALPGPISTANSCIFCFWPRRFHAGGFSPAAG